MNFRVLHVIAPKTQFGSHTAYCIPAAEIVALRRIHPMILPREALAVESPLQLPTLRVLRVFEAIAWKRGLPTTIRFDHGPEFTQTRRSGTRLVGLLLVGDSLRLRLERFSCAERARFNVPMPSTIVDALVAL